MLFSLAQNKSSIAESQDNNHTIYGKAECSVEASQLLSSRSLIVLTWTIITGF